jgi:hypothetical protein
VTGAVEHREAGVFRKARIGLRELAEKELRAASGGDGTRVEAIGAETQRGRKSWVGGIGGHAG